MVAFPESAAVTTPAVKLPEASRETIEPAVLVLVAVVALLETFPAVAMVASLVSGSPVIEVVNEIAELPSKLTPTAVTSPLREIALGVTSRVAVSEFPITGPVCVPAELPVRFPVIVPAEKLPEASRETMLLALLELDAVVAEFETFPAVEIVAYLVTAMAAVAPICVFVITPSGNRFEVVVCRSDPSVCRRITASVPIGAAERDVFELKTFASTADNGV